MRFPKPKYLIFTIITSCLVYFWVSCDSTNDIPGYISNVPDSHKYIYIKASDWQKPSNIDTIEVELWYTSESDTKAVFKTPTDIIRVGNNYWICDPIVGGVFEFDELGRYEKTIVPKGRGPNETIRPSTMNILEDEDELFVYIMDPELKSVIVTDTSGNEVKRISSKTIDRNIFENWIIPLDKNRFLWPTYINDEHLIVEVDSNGDVSKSYVKRLIRRGYQPMTHNSVVMAIDNEVENKIFAYRGLPIIFSEIGNKKFMINLLPETPIENINTGLSELPNEERISVKHLIKALYLNKGKLLIHFQNYLLTTFPDGKQVHAYVLVDGLGERIIPQKTVFTGERLFFIDRFSLRIFSLSLDSLSN